MTGFNWPLTLSLVLASLPGVLIVQSSASRIPMRIPPRPGQPVPSQRMLLLLSLLQFMILVGVAAAVGTAPAPRVGLHAPAFEALAAGQPVWPALQPELPPALGLGVAGAIVFLIAYYGFFRQRLDAQALHLIEGMRLQMGLWGRVLYGGAVEEILARWGLMTLFVWIGAAIFGGADAAVVWLAILLSGTLFALGHLPPLMAQGLPITRWVLATNLTLNLYASILFSWLYWQVGLEAAMIAHATFHLVWYPVDVRFGRGPAAAS